MDKLDKVYYWHITMQSTLKVRLKELKKYE